MNIFVLPSQSNVSGDKCHARKEEPVRMTGRASGANKVHFCTKSPDHGGGHRDDISGKEW